jgi:PAS domain S-box-containing protein
MERSPEVARMHGYQPDEVTPTTRLILSHKHPDDQEQTARSIESIRHARRPFSSRHRICDGHGGIRHVLVVADLLYDERATPVGTQGFYVDVTPTVTSRERAVSAAVGEITERRATIEQAKGMLMSVYDLDADAAFELLRWRSQACNVKLRLLADQLLIDFRRVRYSDTPPSQSTFDQLILTAHTRIHDQAG